MFDKAKSPIANHQMDFGNNFDLKFLVDFTS